MTTDKSSPIPADSLPRQLAGDTPAGSSAAANLPLDRRELVSQDEMDALLLGLGAADAELDAEQAASRTISQSGGNQRAEPVDLSQLPQLTSSRLPGLDALHARLARWLVGQWYEAVGMEVRVTPLMLQSRRYGDLALASADDAHGSLLNLAGLPGQGLLVLDNTLVNAWIDLLYGGSAHVPSRRPDDKKPMPAKISAIGQRALSRLVQQLVVGYSHVWAAAHATPIAHPVRLAGLTTHDARVFACSFQVNVGALVAGFQIWLPHAMVESLLPQWRQTGAEPAAAQNPDWRRRLAQTVQGVSLPLHARWRLPAMPLQRVAGLRPGDVIPLTGMPQLEDQAGSHAMFAGELQRDVPGRLMRLHGRPGGVS